MHTKKNTASEIIPDLKSLGIISDFVFIISGLPAPLAGKNNIAYTTLLDSKEVMGDGDHLTEMIEELELFQEQAAMFEQNAAEKAHCIQTLDAIQGG